MSIITDVKRALQPENRIRTMNRHLESISQSLDIIARAFVVMTERDYGIKITDFDSKSVFKEEADVSYVNDKEQAISEFEENWRKAHSEGYTPDSERSDEERMLEESVLFEENR